MAPFYRLIYGRTDAERDDANRQTTGLAGLAVVLALVVVGLFLARNLHRIAALEDCLSMGRANCEFMVSANH